MNGNGKTMSKGFVQNVVVGTTQNTKLEVNKNNIIS
jgi:hypothetical protein